MKKQANETLRKVLFIPDTHSPYHDKKAFDLVENVVKGIGPIHTCVLGGDFADFYAVSTHNKDPKRKDSFFDEVKVTNKLLRRREERGREEARELHGATS